MRILAAGTLVTNMLFFNLKIHFTLYVRVLVSIKTFHIVVGVRFSWQFCFTTLDLFDRLNKSHDHLKMLYVLGFKNIALTLFFR